MCLHLLHFAGLQQTTPLKHLYSSFYVKRECDGDKKQKERNHIFVTDKVLPRPHALQVVAVGMRHRRYRRMWTVGRYSLKRITRLKQWKWKREFKPATRWRFWLFSVCLKRWEKKGLACWTVKLKLNIDRV